LRRNRGIVGALFAALALVGCNSEPPPIEGVYTLRLEDRTGAERYEATLEVWELGDDVARLIEDELTEDTFISRENAERLTQDFRGIAIARPTNGSELRLVVPMLILDGPFLLGGEGFRIVGNNIVSPNGGDDGISLLIEQDGDNLVTADARFFRLLLLGILPDAITEFFLRELGFGTESLLRVEGNYIQVDGRAEPNGDLTLQPFDETLLNLF